IINSTKSILQLSNLELANFKVTYINQLIDDALEAFLSKLKISNINLIKEYFSDNKAIWADPSQIIQVLHNLIENAIDSVIKNGEIIITTKFCEENNSILISISDTGTGIRLELINKIFNPYFTTKHDGTVI
ncbi:MAG: ATP-binding protein, partial [Ignavibacteria bacterium]|nr:ATP-binding protein [Ignavibacteria bacterium]